MEAIGEDGSIDLSRERTIADVGEGYTFVRDGDVVLAKITPCFENGKGALMLGLQNGIGFGTTELIVVRPVAQKLSPSFLHYLFTSSLFRQAGESWMYGAGGQKRVPDAFVRDAVVPLPALSEQELIAAFLDRETAKIDALVAEQERLIALLKEKRQAVISHAITKGLNPDAPMKDSGVEWLGEVPAHWKVTRLKFVLSDVKAGPFGSSLTKDMYVAEGFRVYGQEQVIPGDFSIGDYYITAEQFAEMRQYGVRAGDILVSCVGTFGKIAIVPQDAEPGIINPRLLRLRCTNCVDERFLVDVLRSHVAFEQFTALSRGGTMDTINLGTLSELLIPLPSLEEQKRLVHFLEREEQRVNALLAEIDSGLALLIERRAALITAAVTGQIDVRGLTPAEAA